MLFRSLDAPDVVLGTFLVNSVPATVLFDSGATHSFVTEEFVAKGGLVEGFLNKTLSIQIPGSTIETKRFCPNTAIEISGEKFAADLIILGTQGIDVILGMNWLAKYHGRIDCARRAVSVTTDKEVEVEYVSETNHSQPGCHESIARPALDEIRVVHLFKDVFPEELPGMPPDRDIEFIIELIPGTAPISQRPYRMNPEELVELKKQLADMLSKGLLRPSASPWGSPIIFVDKRDGTT